MARVLMGLQPCSGCSIHAPRTFRSSISTTASAQGTSRASSIVADGGRGGNNDEMGLSVLMVKIFRGHARHLRFRLAGTRDHRLQALTEPCHCQPAPDFAELFKKDCLAPVRISN